MIMMTAKKQRDCDRRSSAYQCQGKSCAKSMRVCEWVLIDLAPVFASQVSRHRMLKMLQVILTFLLRSLHWHQEQAFSGGT